ncbi:MAG: ABC transporter permease [Verrucomicrobiota bacterium]
MIAKAIRLIQLSGKHLVRHRLRSLLTLLGVASGMFLYTAVETMQQALNRSTRTKASDSTLVVYRENRFCPSTSRLPEYYEDTIRSLEGVREVVPIKITVNNCGASLDVITFRGVPPDALFRYAPEIRILEGSLDAWRSLDDGALIGRHFAAKRGLKPGDAFEGAGVRVRISGIIDSPHPQDNQVAYVHLPFLQQASRHGLGLVTQFNVRVEPGKDLDEMAAAIDQRFRAEAEPTYTQPEKAFFAQTSSELIGLIGFTRWIGYGAVLAVLGLVANAVLLIVRGRVRENAILETIGFPKTAIGFLVLAEGALLGLTGGGLGVGLAGIFLHWRKLTFGNEGNTMALLPDGTTMTIGLGLALVLGMIAALWPAVVAMRKPIVESLRS